VRPELLSTTLQPLEKVRFHIVIDPPVDAPVGSSIAGLQIEVRNTNAGRDLGAEAAVGVRVTSMLHLLLTVPGEVQHDLKVLEAGTRDAFHVGSTRFVIYGLRYRNDGNVDEHVEGAVRIRSLFGNVVDTIPLRERILIRGATGSGRAVWTDVPPFGLFSAELEVRGNDGEPIRASMGRVVLLPPYWVLALLAGLLLLPFMIIGRRRRREWLQYLDAEADAASR